MQDTTKEIRDKVVLVGLNSPVLKQEENADEDTMEELSALVDGRPLPHLFQTWPQVRRQLVAQQVQLPVPFLRRDVVQVRSDVARIEPFHEIGHEIPPFKIR